MKLQFNNSEKLIDYLLPFLNGVGSRMVRTKVQRECYGLAGYLLCQLAQNRLHFPVSIEHRDCPDWAIEMKGELVGVEVTEHKSDNFGKFLRMLEDSNGIGECEELIFPEDQKVISNEKLREMVNRCKLKGSPIIGDRMEMAWGKRVAFTSAWKADKIANYSDADMFSHIDLCIVDVRPEMVSYRSIQSKHRHLILNNQLAYPIRRIVCTDSTTCEFDLLTREWWHGRLDEVSRNAV